MPGYKVTLRSGFGDQVFEYKWFSEVFSLLCALLNGADRVELVIEKEREE